MGSVVDVKESWTGQSGGWSTDGTPNSGEQTATRTFTVVVSNSGTPATEAQVKFASGIPQPRQSHPFNYWLRCESVSATQSAPLLWSVTANYKSESADPDDQNPLNEPPDIQYYTIKTTEGVDEDINGTPIRTKNNEEFAGGVKMLVADLGIRVTRNIAVFNPTSVYLFVNATNSDTFLGFSPGVVLLADLSATVVIEDDFSYFKVSADFHCRKPIKTTAANAWRARVLHQGFKVRDAAGDAANLWHTAYETDADGIRTFVTKPVMLDSDGVEETDPASAHWLEWELYESKNFTTLGLI